MQMQLESRLGREVSTIKINNILKILTLSDKMLLLYIIYDCFIGSKGCLYYRLLHIFHIE